MIVKHTSPFDTGNWFNLDRTSYIFGALFIIIQDSEVSKSCNRAAPNAPSGSIRYKGGKTGRYKGTMIHSPPLWPWFAYADWVRAW